MKMIKIYFFESFKIFEFLLDSSIIRNKYYGKYIIDYFYCNFIKKQQMSV